MIGSAIVLAALISASPENYTDCHQLTGLIGMTLGEVKSLKTGHYQTRSLVAVAKLIRTGSPSAIGLYGLDDHGGTWIAVVPRLQKSLQSKLHILAFTNSVVFSPANPEPALSSEFRLEPCGS